MNEKKVLLTILLSAIFLRIGGNVVREKVFFHKPFLYFGDGYINNITSDELWYDGTAMAFLKGKGVASIDGNRVDMGRFPDWLDRKKVEGAYYAHRHIPPLYPLFLALCYYIGGTNTLSYFIPQLILGSLTCLFIYLLAKEIFNKKVAALAGFAVAFYPDLIFHTNFVFTETLFIVLLVFGFWLLVKGDSRDNIFLISMSAIVFGLACLTRVTFIPFLPLLFLWQILFSRNDRKKSFKASFLMILLIILVLLPWCIRNFLVFDKFTPFTNEVNVAFVGTLNDPVKYSEGEFYCRSYDSFILRAIAFIKDRPKEYLLSSLRRLVIFWSPFTAPMQKIAKLYKGMTWLVVFPLAFWGIIAARNSWKKSGLLIIFIFYYALLHAGSFVDTGLVYRYPIQPFLSVFTGYGAYAIYMRFKYGRKI